MTRIEEIQQKILELAQQEDQKYSGITGEWARKVLAKWANQSDSSQKLKVLKDIFNTGYTYGGHGYHFDSEVETQVIKLFNEWRDLIEEQLNQELTTERETTQQALQTSQEWHERQKQELITEWSTKYQTLVNKWKSTIQQELTLLREILKHE